MSECKFCKNVDTGNDIYPIISMSTDFGVFGKADIDVTLAREFTNPDKVIMVVSIIPEYGDDAEEKEMRINYCPMCGRKF